MELRKWSYVILAIVISLSLLITSLPGLESTSSSASINNTITHNQRNTNYDQPKTHLTSTRPDNYPIRANWETWIRDKDHNRLDDNFDELIADHTSEPFNIYINYKTWPTDADIEYLSTLDVNVTYTATYIPTICAREVPLETVKRILCSPRVAMIEQMPYLVPFLDVSARSILARESEEYSPETAWELGFTGRGITIAILDTGVDDRHESLQNKYVAGYDCTLRVPRETNPDDEDGHGTHCAGIAMGTGGDEGQYIGIAPNAKLVDIKVLNDIGLTPGDQILDGIEYCINNKDQYGIDILSISIGDLFSGNDDGSGTHAQLIDAASDEGLVMVVAAGNDGPNNNGFSSLASADGAITVGSINEQETVKRSDDRISDFSNRGPRADDGDGEGLDELKPDVVAPGEDIMSALYSETQVGLITGYQPLSGTSMACPHVAGLAALILEANPNLTPLQVKQIIRDTADPRGHPSYQNIDPVYNVDYGWGSVNAYEAVRKVLGEDYQFIDILSHEQWDVVHNVITVYGTAYIESGSIRMVEYKIDDSTWHDAKGQSDWSFTLDTTTLDATSVRITIRSFDGVEYSQEVYLDLIVANIGTSIIAPMNATSVKGKILIKGTSFGANVESVLIKIGDESWTDVQATSGSGNYSTWQYEWNTNDIKEGWFTIYTKAYNNDWYSKPDQIELYVNNRTPEPSGFLPGFFSSTMLFALLAVIMLGFFGFGRREGKRRF